MPTEPASEPLAIGYCRVCGKGLTAETVRYAGGTIYCVEHIPVVTRGAVESPVESAAGGSTSPALAFFLGLIPGVGAIYNGQYAKGLIHAVVFGLLVSISSHGHLGSLEPLFGIMTAAFVFYMAFEARHTAIRRMRGETVDEFSSLIDAQSRQSYSGALALIFLGIVFLLDTLDILAIRQMVRFWPVLLIAAGLSMLYSRIRAESEPKNTPPPSLNVNPEMRNEQ
ncbi:MAG: LiaI-LiaF-like domain-containing protein [Bryobacteraceae bacterium]